MHVVVWTAGDERFAIRSSLVVEVVPVVEPRRLTHTPAWLAGLINYRGALVPLLDLTTMVGEGPAAVSRASRIIVVRLPNADTELVALLVESLERVTECDFHGTTAQPALHTSEAPHMGPVAMTDHGSVQLIVIEALLRDDDRAMLFDRTAEAAS